MERKIKLVAAISLVGLSAAACAPNPYWQAPGYTNRSTTTTAGTVNKAAVSHSHCGRVHSHALPPQGLAHHHGDGCVGGSAGGQPQGTVRYNNPQPVNPGSYYVPPAATTTGGTTTYGYTGGDAGYYGSGGDYSTGGGSGSYYDYSKPKDSAGSTSSSSSEPYYYNYSSGASSSGSSSSSSTSSSGSTYSGGGTYVVQKGDTVFQAMRNTGVYWKDIIRLNNLQAPDYTITPGQRLRLK